MVSQVERTSNTGIIEGLAAALLGHLLNQRTDGDRKKAEAVIRENGSHLAKKIREVLKPRELAEFETELQKACESFNDVVQH